MKNGFCSCKNDTISFKVVSFLYFILAGIDGNNLAIYLHIYFGLKYLTGGFYTTSTSWAFTNLGASLNVFYVLFDEF